MDLPTVVAQLRKGESLPDSTVVLTFDDGYESVYSEVFPRLKKLGWPFTVFVCPEALDHRRGPVVSWDQLREMSNHGATIALHGLHHGFMNRAEKGENPSQHHDRLKNELIQAQKRLVENQLPAHSLLAFPYGEYSSTVLSVVDELGWTGFGQQSGVVFSGSDFSCLPRFPMAAGFAQMPGFKIKTSALPLPVISNGVIDPNLNSEQFETKAPQLLLKVDFDCLKGAVITAFASGQGQISSIWDEENVGLLKVQASNPLPRGRSRYNVTAPVLDTGRWYWYSQVWITGTDHNY